MKAKTQVVGVIAKMQLHLDHVSPNGLIMSVRELQEMKHSLENVVSELSNEGGEKHGR